jgi:hypothetical protein
VVFVPVNLFRDTVIMSCTTFFQRVTVSGSGGSDCTGLPTPKMRRGSIEYLGAAPPRACYVFFVPSSSFSSPLIFASISNFDFIRLPSVRLPWSRARPEVCDVILPLRRGSPELSDRVLARIFHHGSRYCTWYNGHCHTHDRCSAHSVTLNSIVLHSHA